MQHLRSAINKYAHRVQEPFILKALYVCGLFSGIIQAPCQVRASLGFTPAESSVAWSKISRHRDSLFVMPHLSSWVASVKTRVGFTTESQAREAT